jgi:Fe-S-cluster containining protein
MSGPAASWESRLEGMFRSAQRAGLFESLGRVYADFPEVTCDNCARCCFESPGVFFVEHLDTLRLLSDMPTARREELLRRTLRELFFSWIEPDRTCIFLEPSGCAIYERRPLACRLFGVVSHVQRDQAEAEARMAARHEATRLELMGIKVPEAVITRALLSCDRVRDQRGQPVRIDAEAMAARVADLDAALLPREVVLQEFCFHSVGERLGAAAFGQETVHGMRLPLLRRAQEGEPVDDLLEEVWQRAGLGELLQTEVGDR